MSSPTTPLARYATHYAQMAGCHACALWKCAAAVKTPLPKASSASSSESASAFVAALPLAEARTNEFDHRSDPTIRLSNDRLDAKDPPLPLFEEPKSSHAQHVTILRWPRVSRHCHGSPALK